MKTLSADETDALAEIVNIGAGRAAASLSELLGARIKLVVPRIHFVDAPEKTNVGMAILQGFEGSVSGRALLAFPPESGQQLARLLGGFEADDELPALELTGILSEVGNIVLNGILGSLANIIEEDLKYTVPDFWVNQTLDAVMGEDKDSHPESSEQMSSVLMADTHFTVDSENIEGSIILCFELGSLENIIHCLLEGEPASVEG